MNEKRKPIEERIAALFGRSAYRDVRDGVGGTRITALSDQDLAAAVGYVVRQQGRVAAQVLETYYGSTLAHAPALRRAWEDRERQEGESRQKTVLTRFAGELAIRQLAGIKYATTDFAEYAYLLCSRRETLQQRVDDATRWLYEVRDTAMIGLRNQVRESANAA